MMRRIAHYTALPLGGMVAFLWVTTMGGVRGPGGATAVERAARHD